MAVTFVQFGMFSDSSHFQAHSGDFVRLTGLFRLFGGDFAGSSKKNSNWRNDDEKRGDSKTPGSSDAHLQLEILLLEFLIFIRVTVRELIYFDTVLLNLLSDLQGQMR